MVTFSPQVTSEGEDGLVTVNCTVAYMGQCMSWNKCKASCTSMGSSSYRWSSRHKCFISQRQNKIVVFLQKKFPQVVPRWLLRVRWFLLSGETGEPVWNRPVQVRIKEKKWENQGGPGEDGKNKEINTYSV